MDIESLKDNYPLFQIVTTLVMLFLFLLLRRFLARSVIKRALLHNFDETRTQYIRKSIKWAALILFMVVLGIVWDISIKGLSVYIASFITVVGVGLFANWSIVSNVTASVILFFFFPLKIGSTVKIVDGDNSAEGVVESVSLFSIKIRRADGNEIYYPNNLAIQKSIIHLKEQEAEQAPDAED